MRRSSVLLVLFLILVGCEAGTTTRFVTFTPEASTVPAVTVTPDPTPTREPNGYFVPINPNAGLLFNASSLERYDNSERWYCVPMQFGFEYSYPAHSDTPRIPLWINCDVDNRNGGIMTLEIADIDGTYTWRALTIPFDTGRCYLAKVVGFSRISVKPDGQPDNIAFSAYIEDGAGDRYDLGRKSFRRYGSIEPFWVFWTDKLAPTATIGFSLVIDYATFLGAIDIDNLQIEEVPPDYCENIVAW